MPTELQFNVEVKVATDDAFRPVFPAGHQVATWLTNIMTLCWRNEAADRPSFSEIIRMMVRHDEGARLSLEGVGGAGNQVIIDKQEKEIAELEDKVTALKVTLKTTMSMRVDDSKQVAELQATLDRVWDENKRLKEEKTKTGKD